MRKLKLAMYVSLDGVVENPGWTGPFWDDELSRLQAEYLYSSDALQLVDSTTTGTGVVIVTYTANTATGETAAKRP